MKQAELSRWLKIIVIVAALSCLALCIFIVPQLGRAAVRHYPEYSGYYLPCLIFFWVSALPVFAALIKAWEIFREIGKDNSFCAQNAARLRVISIMALADTIYYIIGAVVLAALNMLHPALMIILIGVLFIGFTVMTASAALSHLTQKAASLKDENDLTI